MKIVGHRGASGLASDNDLEAIQLGIDCHVDYIEIDLQKTKDDRLLVHHDDEILVQAKKYSIRKLSSQQINQLLAGEQSEAIYLEDVMAYVKKRSPNTGLFLDCKNTKWAKALTNHLKKYESDKYTRKNIVVVSFSYWGLLHFKLLNADIETIYLFRNTPIIHLPLTFLSRFTGAGYYITQGIIALPISLIKKFGMKLFFYNVNNLPLLRRCQELGIDYIETDKPNIIVPAVKNIKLKTSITSQQ